jgi:Tol biopolymer transport system component
MLKNLSYLFLSLLLVYACNDNPLSNEDTVINWEGHEGEFNYEVEESILFCSDRCVGTQFIPSVHIMKNDGSGIKALTTSWFTFGASWSQRRWKIIYITDSISTESSKNLYIMNFDGSGKKRITPLNEEVIGTAVWSPDGQKIAYIEKDSTDQYDQSRVRLINPDGSNSRVLTDWFRNLKRVTWSNDSKQIVFSGFKPGSNDKLYIVNSDGSNCSTLLAYSQGSFSPSWCLDSNLVAFSSFGYIGPDLYSQIFTYDIDTNEVKRITNSKTLDYNPTWSSDGDAIIFSSRVAGEESVSSIMRINKDGTNLVKLTDELGDDWAPFCYK